MSAAETALSFGVLHITMAFAVGYGLFKLIKVKGTAVSAVDTGRKWLAWAVFFSTLSTLPKFFRLWDLDSFAIWLMATIVFGGCAYVIGFVVGKISKSAEPKREGGAASTPEVGEITTRMPNRDDSDREKELLSGTNIKNQDSSNLAASADKDYQVETVRPTEAIPPVTISDQEAQAIEDESYTAAWEEVEQGTTDRGTWAKAFAQTGGDEAKTRATYLNLRVPRLVEARRDQLIRKKTLVREEARAKAERELQDRLTAEEKEKLAALRSTAGNIEEQLNRLRHTSTPPMREVLKWRGPGGETALYQQAERCNQDGVLYLLAWGADTSVRTKFGETALDAARRLNCKAVVGALEAAEALAQIHLIETQRSN